MAPVDFTAPTTYVTQESLRQQIHGGIVAGVPKKGAVRFTVALTGPTNYRPNGSVLNLSAICPNKVLQVDDFMFVDSTKANAYWAHYEITSSPATGKVHVYKPAGSAIAFADLGDVDLSGFTALLVGIGY